MGSIFYLMGKSSSGKDTLYKRLLSDPQLGLKKVTMYTTRPIRSGEKEGAEYHFVSEDEMNALFESGRIIERRSYDTVHGFWYYFTVDDGLDEGSDYLMIGTLESYVKMKEYYGADRVYPMLIETDDGDRLQRALNRERRQEKPRYREMCRRFLADEEDFSAEKIKAAGIESVFRNDDLRVCLNMMKEFILEKAGKKA
ncbi:MAG: guanylate kinase [Lachnospiraceae bacterium]|nr:guanylate kinase [Lachnospiraceae bacterium]